MVVEKGKKKLILKTARTYPKASFYWLKKYAVPKDDGQLTTNQDTNYDVLVMGDHLSEVNPRLYGDKPIDTKSCFIDPVQDNIDMHDICKAIDQGKKIIAVGRSAQIACLAAGGKVLQFAYGHAVHDTKNMNKIDTHHTHSFKGFDGYQGHVTSYHQGLMFPFLMQKNQYSILAYTTKANDYYHYETNFDNKEDFLWPPTEGQFHQIKIDKESDWAVDPEMIFFRNINCLAIQYDPMSLMLKEKRSRDFKWTSAVVKMFLDDRL